MDTTPATPEPRARPDRHWLSLPVGWLLGLKKWGKLVLIYLGGRPPAGQVRVSYEHQRIPAPPGVMVGGMVKFVPLKQILPHSPWRFNILYLGSSTLPRDLPELIRLARRKGAKIVLNQNGVGYPAWAGADWQTVNRPMQAALKEADYIFYQSEFCKRSADHFLGPGRGAWEILYNPVDTDFFRPAPAPFPSHELVLLQAGTAKSFYRFETGVRTLGELCRRGLKARLMVAGHLAWDDRPQKSLAEAQGLLEQLGLRDLVTLLPPYSRSEAPTIFQQAHIMLHTKVNDPCPAVVLEALACGLPVVYAQSGGVPELVGPEAGIGVPDRANWEADIPPDPAGLADAVTRVWEKWPEYSRAARTRAAEKFDLKPWLERHREVFARLVQ
ncbi:MAG: glycosyltransferase family 4 protein [Thermodesulfobacteriota bacterium]